jgi:hypothetical protein
VLLLGVSVSVGACAEREHALPRVLITTPVGDKSADVIISYILYDKESLPANISVHYSVDGGQTFSTSEATQGLGGDGTTGLSSSLRGVAHSYVWNSLQDVGAANHNDVRISITPTTRRTGKTAYTGNFIVKNFVFSAWSGNVRVDDGPAGSSAESPAICTDATTIYAAWSDNRDGDYDIFYSRSADAGVTWSAAVKVNDVSTGIQRSPAIATDGAGKVYLVWEDGRGTDYDIYISVGEDPGTGFAFGPSARVDDGASGDATAPAIAVEGSTVYVAWTDSRDDAGDIYVRRSEDGAASWPDPAIRVNTTTTALQEAPALWADGAGKLFIVWADSRDGNSDIYFDWGSDSGGVLVFLGNKRVDTDTTGAAASLPTICSSPTNLYIFWTDARTDSGDIYFSRSTDGGTTWDAEKKVNTDTGTALQSAPLSVASGANVYVAWQDFRDSDANIYFSESADSGTNFTPEVRIDDDVTSAAQSAPAVSLQGSSVIVAYQDARSTDADIYFTKK